MPTFEMPLFFDDVTANVKFADLPTPSGSLTNTGLYLADDSVDPTDSVLGTNATLVDGESLRTIPADDIHTGDTLLVKAGERISADVLLLKGDTTTSSMRWTHSRTAVKEEK